MLQAVTTNHIVLIGLYEKAVWSNWPSLCVVKPHIHFVEPMHASSCFILHVTDQNFAAYKKVMEILKCLCCRDTKYH